MTDQINILKSLKIETQDSLPSVIHGFTYSCYFHNQFSNGTHDWVFNDLNIGCIKYNLNRSPVKRRMSQVYLVV